MLTPLLLPFTYVLLIFQGTLCMFTQHLKGIPFHFLFYFHFHIFFSFSYLVVFVVPHTLTRTFTPDFKFYFMYILDVCMCRLCPFLLIQSNILFLSWLSQRLRPFVTIFPFNVESVWYLNSFILSLVWVRLVVYFCV